MARLKVHCEKDTLKDIYTEAIGPALITKAVQEYGPKGEAGRLFKEAGVNWKQVTCLQLSFKRIVKIENLWTLSALTKLTLNNNMIEKIENLNRLVNLKELNLSFNYIKKIEHINHLINLENLSLYGNRIQKIQNMHSLKNLRIFSIGGNQIKERGNFIHLRRLKLLNCLEIDGNPCCEIDGTQIYVVAFLPQLTYLNYKGIKDELRAEARKTHRPTLKRIEKIEKVRDKKETKRMKEHEDAQFYSKSFVEYLNDRQLFDSLFKHDPDGRNFLEMREIRRCYRVYESEFLAVTKKLFQMGQEKCKIRDNEIAEYTNCINKAILENQKHSQEEIERFINKHSKIIQEENNVSGVSASSETESHESVISSYSDSEIFYESVESTRKFLLNLEMELCEQISDANLTFERSLTDFISEFKEEARGYFTECRNTAEDYVERVSIETFKAITTYMHMEDPDLPPEVLKLLDNMELLDDAIATSYDIHMQLIDNREDRLIHRSKTWLKNYIKKIQRDEITRHRKKIREINHFLEIQTQEYEPKVSEASENSSYTSESSEQ